MWVYSPGLHQKGEKYARAPEQIHPGDVNIAIKRYCFDLPGTTSPCVNLYVFTEQVVRCGGLEARPVSVEDAPS